MNWKILMVVAILAGCKNNSSNAPGVVTPVPVAVISGIQNTQKVGVPITLDGALSLDFADKTLDYHWDIQKSPMADANEKIVNSEKSVASFTPLHTGDYEIKLTVHSDSGISSNYTKFTVK